MKKQFSLITLLALIFALNLSAQTIRPSGNIISENFDKKGFVGIDISTDFKAIVTKADQFSVRIESDDNLMPHILVEKRGGVLVVKHAGNLNIQGKEILVAHISMPNLESVRGSSDAIIELTNKFKIKHLLVELSSDSVLKGEIDVENLEAKLSGDSYLTFWGTANKVEAQLRGDSVIKNYDFVINQLDLDLRGDSVAELTIEDQMKVNLNGDSEMRYKGSPNIVQQSVRGDSEIYRVN